MPIEIDHERYRVSISPCPSLALLGPVWSALEERSEGSAFVSWAWIGALLAQAAAPALLAEVWEDQRLIGLAILGRPRPAPRPWEAATLHLNESGVASADAIMIEYNAVLAEAGREAPVADALLRALTRQTGVPRWDELYLSGVDGAWGERCQRLGLDCRLVRPPQAAPFSDLAAAPGGDPGSMLSRNTRQKVQRSTRFFAALGPLSLARPTGADEALSWFDDLERLHTRSWQARGKPGAFAVPEFGRFHRQMIGAQFERRRVDLLCLRAGTTPLGYLYALRGRDTVLAYQSGFLYHADPRWRPGLVAHVMAMRLYRAEGIATYRFLAGDARYKRSLSTGCDELFWMVASRRSVTALVRRAARRVGRVLSRPLGIRP